MASVLLRELGISHAACSQHFCWPAARLESLQSLRGPDVNHAQIKLWYTEMRSFLNCEHTDAAGSVKDGAWQAHDAILEMLNLHGAGQQKLGTGGEGPGNFSKPGAAGSPGKPAQATEAAAGAFPGSQKPFLFLTCLSEYLERFVFATGCLGKTELLCMQVHLEMTLLEGRMLLVSCEALGAAAGKAIERAITYGILPAVERDSYFEALLKVVCVLT